MNCKVAELCGWSHIENTNTMAIGGIWRGYPPIGAIIGKKDYIPNYCGDLNECGEMEKYLLDPEEQVRYTLLLLNKSVGFDDAYESGYYGKKPEILEMFSLATASPQNRVETFLKIKGEI